jgi:phosphoglucomutase
MAIDLAEKIGADLVIATDPDADRTESASAPDTGDYQVLSVIRSAVLMEYICRPKAAPVIPERSFVVTTIVSTKLTKKIAEAYGSSCSSLTASNLLRN